MLAAPVAHGTKIDVVLQNVPPPSPRPVRHTALYRPVLPCAALDCSTLRAFRTVFQGQTRTSYTRHCTRC